MNRQYTLLETLLRYKQILFIITGVALAIGVIALLMMPRDEYPEFVIRQGIIVGVFPGASSAQVEEQLTTRVENHLFQYKSVNRAKTYSISKENVMVVYVEVAESEKDPDAFWAKLRHGLTELKRDLPPGVVSLSADNDFGNTSALLFAVHSRTRSYRELERHITDFENDVRRVPSVSRVRRYGMQKEQVGIYIDDAKLANHGIKPLMFLAALQPQSSVAYAGEIDDGITVRPVHIPMPFTSEADVANQIVVADPLGHVVRVRDVARVVREYDEPDSFIRVNGEKCLVVSLEMREGRNIVQFGTDVSDAVARFSRALPPDVEVATITDMPGVVSTAIMNFLREFAISIIVVILVTVLLLPRRVAFVAASSIPVSILITLGLMWAAGISLQTVSLASLIIVLGMVVDNAIVIVDNYVEKLDHDISPHDAASESVRELFGSVFSATLILICCFLPITYFMTGTAGDFVASLPSTVFIALSVSLLVSVLLVPVLCFMYIRHGIRGAAGGTRGSALLLDRMQRGYDTLIALAFRHKKGVAMTGALSFVAGLILLAFVPQQTFPKIERNQFAVEVQLPVGSSLAQTDRVLAVLEDTLERDPRVRLVTSFVGTSSPRFHAVYAPKFPARHYGQLVVVTASNEATAEVLAEYGDAFAGRFPNADIKWRQLELAGYKAPVEVLISGDSIPALKRTAARVAGILRATEGTGWVRSDWQQPLQSVDLDLRRDEASRLGYSGAILGYSLMAGTRGLPVATIWEGDHPVGVQLKMEKREGTGVRDLRNLYVTSPFLAASVPLRQLADLHPGWSEGEIVRRNGVRTITVLAEIERGHYATDVLGRARPAIEQLTLPDGIAVAYGGEYQDTIDYISPMYWALMASVVLIFIILMFQFRSIKTTLLIMSTMPLCLFGAAFGLSVTGYPLSVTAFIGLIGLMGIVVRNGIIFVSHAEDLRRRHNMPLEEAAVTSARRRMRPIFLTSAAAAVGVVPMIMSGSSLWGPLGSVICFGLVFGMVLSLSVVPVLYHLFHRSDFNAPDEVEEMLEVQA